MRERLYQLESSLLNEISSLYGTEKVVETEAYLMRQKIAYFSMEIGVDARLPTCCGGLGVLAGDTIKGSAEMNFPLVGVSLRHHKGYFEQEIVNYQQKEVLKRSNPFGVLRKRDEKVKVQIEGRNVTIGAEEYKYIFLTLD
jgi:starch phosphorylase